MRTSHFTLSRAQRSAAPDLSLARERFLKFLAPSPDQGEVGGGSRRQALRRERVSADATI
jgi:hypothetical protein